MIEEIAPEEKERRFNEALDQLQRTVVIAVLPQGLTAPAFSFPFYFLLNAFFPARLSRWTHELVATLAYLSDQGLARAQEMVASALPSNEAGDNQ